VFDDVPLATALAGLTELVTELGITADEPAPAAVVNTAAGDEWSLDAELPLGCPWRPRHSPPRR